MSDIIQLLPDSVANQIAAGEVIQRPASAVKEMMENAIDAGSNTIRVIIKDAGKTLLQIIDNGCGMSETDARLCFERYATSKLRTADDLLSVRTMGFRGEALASIAAIAQVEMKTKRTEDEVGTCVRIDGAVFINQESVATPAGTSLSVKNLFYNVPARRNFLKSDAVETRHIIEEFQRIAIARPEINFSLHHNGMEVFNLKSGNLRQRVANVFGGNYNERLIPVLEETSILNISGFVGKPEFAKKLRGEQYFYVNRRFVKDAYLNHAVASAFAEMLPKGTYPSYFLFIEMDPSKIDINIHPTKTEIKFEDEKSVYAIMRAAVKQALGKFSGKPLLDFEKEASFELPVSRYSEPAKIPNIIVNKNFNPFEINSGSPAPSFKNKATPGWEKLYEGIEQTEIAVAPESKPQQIEFSKPAEHGLQWLEDATYKQLLQRYIVIVTMEQLLVVDQQAAHERVLYEKNMDALQNKPAATQQQLFPRQIEFSTEDFLLLKELEHEIKLLGFDFNDFGKNTIVIHGTPVMMEDGNEKQILESVLENYKTHQQEYKNNKVESLSRCMARNFSVKQGKTLTEKEMKNIAFDLFSSRNPYFTPAGRPVLIRMDEAKLRAGFYVK